jgi:hypothetical protein
VVAGGVGFFMGGLWWISYKEDKQMADVKFVQFSIAEDMFERVERLRPRKRKDTIMFKSSTLTFS